MLVHPQQIEEFAIIEGQLGITGLVSCRRASNRDFVDAPRTWVFSIGCCPHNCRSQVFALIVSALGGVYLYDSTGRACSGQP